MKQSILHGEDDRFQKGFALVSALILMMSFVVPPRVHAADIVPPGFDDNQVFDKKVRVPDPRTPIYTKPDPAHPGKCIGGDKSCRPPCGVSNNAIGPCESTGANCQPSGMQSCDAQEKANQKGDGKPGEVPKLPEIPKGGGGSGQGQPPTDPCQLVPTGATPDPNCPKATTGTGSFLDSLVGGATKIGESISGVAQSAADQLQTMISGVNDSGGSGQGSFNTPPLGSVSNSGSQGSGSQDNSPTAGLGAGVTREGGTVPASGPVRDTAGNADSFTRPTAAAGFGPPPSNAGNSGSQSGTATGGISGALSTAMSALGGLLSNFSSIFHF